MTADHDALTETIGRAVLAAARVPEGDAPLDVDAHLRLVAASSRAEGDARMLLHRSVAAARAGGASWARIGAELGMSRQAAQQRFGGEPGALNDVAESATGSAGEERWLGPVTAFDELPELGAAGRQGWRTIGAAMLAHRMLRTDTQWEHRRILWRASLDRDLAEGWQVGCRAFPWIYLVRDLGLPVEQE